MYANFVGGLSGYSVPCVYLRYLYNATAFWHYIIYDYFEYIYRATLTFALFISSLIFDDLANNIYDISAPMFVFTKFSLIITSLRILTYLCGPLWVCIHRETDIYAMWKE